MTGPAMHVADVVPTTRPPLRTTATAAPRAVAVAPTMAPTITPTDTSAVVTARVGPIRRTTDPGTCADAPSPIQRVGPAYSLGSQTALAMNAQGQRAGLHDGSKQT